MNSDTYIQPPVADIETERHLIGILLCYGDLVADAMDTLTQDSFYDSRCREVWRLIAETASNGERVDILTVSARLMKTRGATITPVDIAELSGLCYSSVNFGSLVRRLHELEIRRKLRTVGLQIQNLSANEYTPIEECLSNSRELIDKATESDKDSVSTLTDALQAVERSLGDRLQGGDRLSYGLQDA